MTTVITYGTYDMFHYGHRALLERAKKLGDYLIVGVTSETFDRNRGKLNVRQSLVERIDAVKETGLADKIVVEEYEGQKIDDIQKYDVDIFTVGSDWVGHFDYLNDYCKVVYLDRTEGISSTQLRETSSPALRVGIVGSRGPVTRFVNESKFVSGFEVTAAYQQDAAYRADYCARNALNECGSYESLLENVDAVYIATDVNRRYEDVMKALECGKHVMCEEPAFLDAEQASRAIEYASSQGLVLFEALKTLYFPAFEHLQLVIRSGAIGAVRDIDVTCTHIPARFEEVRQNRYMGAIYDWGSVAIMPILRFLGIGYRDARLYSYEQDQFNVMAKGDFHYGHATATFKVGQGIKSEGDMVITGTDGYIYVPAPWWKTDYFELRTEDLSAARKYYYKFEGDGLRYEMLGFMDRINGRSGRADKRPAAEVLETARILGRYEKGDVICIG